MRKLISIMMVIGFLAFGLTTFAEDNEKTFYRGWVKELRTERMYDAVMLKPGGCKNQDYNFRFWYSGEITKVAYEKIKTLEWISKLKQGHDGVHHLIKMTLRDGNIYKVHSDMPKLCLTIIDPFSKQPKSKFIGLNKSITINFLEQLGGIKRCEKDQLENRRM